MFKRIVSFVLVVAVLCSYLPTYALELDLEQFETSEELRLAIMGEDMWVENYPHGLFNFIGTEYILSEDNAYYEFAIARQGGTAGEVSVDIKAIDVSAEYGEDYTIRIYEGLDKFGKYHDAKRDENSVPLMNTIADNPETNLSGLSDTSEQQESGEDLQESEPKYTPGASDDDEYTELTKYVNENENLSLREAKAVYTGVESDRTDWKEIDSSTAAELKEAHNELYSSIPGATGTVHFADGEYIKFLRIIPVNHNKPVGHRQSILVLQNATGDSETGEFYTATMQILDDKALEAGTFEIAEAIITADGEKAQVTVLRLGSTVNTEVVVVGTVEDTALPGADYAAGLTELTFIPGMTMQTVTVDILPNIYRDTERIFYICLGDENENINKEKASCEVRVPASEGAMGASEISARLSSLMFETNEFSDGGLLQTFSAEVTDNSVNGSVLAEQISTYGYPPEGEDEVGVWYMSPLDFFNEKSNRHYACDVGGQKGYLRLEASNDLAWAHDNITRLYGVDRISYYVIGDATSNFTLMLEIRGGDFNPDISDSKIERNHGKYTQSINVGISKNRWTNTSIGLYMWQGRKEWAKQDIYNFKLHLKRYNIEINDAAKLNTRELKITNGSLSTANSTSYNPGKLIATSIYSNVNNKLSLSADGKSFGAYRSDFISFEVEYSKDNEGGKLAKYIGYEVGIQNSEGIVEKWIQFDGTELRLDIAFYEKMGVSLLTSSKDAIQIRPRFESVKAAKVIFTRANAAGYYANLGVNVDNKEFTSGINIGDTIIDISAVGTSGTSLTPTFSCSYSNSGDGKGASQSSSDERFIVTDKSGANAIGKLLIKSAYTKLNLTFSNPTVTIKANPSFYPLYPINLKYTVDGVVYDVATKREELTKKMELIYKEDKDASIKLEFATAISSAAAYKNFGEPERAVLTVYSASGSPRGEGINLILKNGIYSFSGKLKELKWQAGDYATVHFSKGEGKNEKKTTKTVIDFLITTENAVMVTSPIFDVGYINSPITIKDASPTTEYVMRGTAVGEFITTWRNMSMDFDDDGKESFEEKKAAVDLLKALGYSGELNYNSTEEKFSEVRNSAVFYGDTFSIKPKYFPNTKIYYSFVERANSNSGTVTLALAYTGNTVLNPNVTGSPRPIRDAVVMVGGKVLEIKEVGEKEVIYELTDDTFQSGMYYVGTIYDEPFQYQFICQPDTAANIEINPSRVLAPINFKAEQEETYEKDYKTYYEYKKLDLETKNGSAEVNIYDKNIKFTYEFSNASQGITPSKSKIRIYNGKTNKLRYEYEVVPKGTKHEFIINPYRAGIKPGDIMSISAIYQDLDGKDTEFPEVYVGLTFMQPLTAVTIAASFFSGVAPVLSLLGKVIPEFDLGSSVTDVDNAFAKSTVTDSDGNERNFKQITFGFMEKNVNMDIKDGIIQAVKKPKDKEKDKDNSVEGKLSSGGTDKKGTSDTVKKGVDEDKAKSSTSGEGALSFKFKMAITIILEVGTMPDPNIKGVFGKDGYHYFSAFVIVATAEASANYKSTFVTPIGIPGTASISATGKAVMTFGVEADHDNPYSEMYKLSDKGTVTFNPMDYSMYTKFYLEPSITVGAGLGWDMAGVEVSGNATFDFNFSAPVLNSNVKAKGDGGLVFSAWISVNILFFSKKWTLYQSDHITLFDTSSKKSVQKLLSNPYMNYAYKSVGDIDDENILTRDYLENKSDWLGDASMRLFAVRSGEKVLINSAYPYPETKLVDLGNGKNMLLFVDDAADRDTRNRAILKYSIGSGQTWSAPIAVEDDGTWDQQPDAFLVNNKVLIVWCDAGRKYTSDDDEITTMKETDITGVWYDIESDSLGQPFEITHSRTGDDNADIKPKISFNDDYSELMLYYTKIDYEDRWKGRDENSYNTDDLTLAPKELNESDKALYGDIVNGYNTIVYRKATLNSNNEYVWSSEYNQNEGFTDKQAAQFYGQRFLDLAISTEITETEEIITEAVDNETISSTKVTQTAAYKELINDPRVVDFDLTSYNDLAVFAYTVDTDSNISTGGDQNLYIQLYDYQLDYFVYPIIISGGGSISKPQFIRVNEYTYLYWIENGDIKCINISSLIQTNLELIDVTGSPAGFQDKIYVARKGTGAVTPITAIEHAQDKEISEFDLQTNGNELYIIWTDYVLTYKDGLQPGDEGTQNFENVNREKQIFAAYSSPDNTDGYGKMWSNPVQVTFGEGVSYSDISFLVNDDSSLLLSYVRHEQELVDGVYTENVTDRKLAVNRLEITSTAEFGEITMPEKILAETLVPISIEVTNTGVKPILEPQYKVQVKNNGEITFESEWITAEKYLLGGSTMKVIYPFILSNLDGASIVFVLDDGIEEIYHEEGIFASPNIDINIDAATLTGKNKAHVLFDVCNVGNLDFDGILNLTNEPLTLKIGEKKSFMLDVLNLEFGSAVTLEDGSLQSSAPISIKVSGGGYEFELVTEVFKNASEGIKNALESVNFSPTLTARMTAGEVYAMNIPFDIPDELEIVYGTSDSDILLVDYDGYTFPIADGAAKITATLRPKSTTVSAREDGYDIVNDWYNYPDEIIKQKTFEITVGNSGTGYIPEPYPNSLTPEEVVEDTDNDDVDKFDDDDVKSDDDDFKSDDNYDMSIGDSDSDGEDDESNNNNNNDSSSDESGMNNNSTDRNPATGMSNTLALIVVFVTGTVLAVSRKKNR